MGSGDKLVAASKFMSWVLRHEPEAIGLSLDAQGWCAVDDLVARATAHGTALTRALVEEVVRENAKQRFALSEDGVRIRASQGHTVEVELGYASAEPPAVLFHGTVAAALPAIRAAGLSKMARHHVHLSPDAATARIVGARRGAPVILQIDAAAMRTAGHVFYVSANGVWLVEHVPPSFIVFPP